MVRRSEKRSRRRLTVMAGVLALGSGVLSGTAMAAPMDRSFTASAEASGGYIQYGIPGFLVVENFIDGGGPVAGSVLDSVGTVQAFGSLPYPGPNGILAPGLINALTGVPAPPYPFYAGASYPTQSDAKVSDPTGVYSLSGQAREHSSIGEARFGSPRDSAAAGSWVRSETALTDGTVSASASSLNRAFSVGPLSVASAKSSSVTSYEAGSERAVSKTELSVEGGRVGDTAFRFGPDGLHVAQNGVPLPAGEGLTALNKALQPAGLSVNFVAETAIPGGAVAAVFEIASVADVPTAGRGTLRIRLGGARSAISLADAPGTSEDAGSEAKASAGPSASPTGAPAMPLAPAAKLVRERPGAAPAAIRVQPSRWGFRCTF